jgi:hypothetical protein
LLQEKKSYEKKCFEKISSEQARLFFRAEGVESDHAVRGRRPLLRRKMRMLDD